MDNGKARVKAACRFAVELSIDREMRKHDPASPDDRAERLAQALRANLRRRKAQARAAEEARADSEKPKQ